MAQKAYDKPSEATAVKGNVLVNGPDGVAVTLTPEAAEMTSDRLLFAAGAAKSQQLVAGTRKAGASGELDDKDR